MPDPEERPGDWVPRLDRLYTAVVADVLDRLGYRNQVVRADVRPLSPDARAVGFALTVQAIPARELAPAAPYRGELAAVDALQPDDVRLARGVGAALDGRAERADARVPPGGGRGACGQAQRQGGEGGGGEKGS